MNFNEARKELDLGKITWRSGWHDKQMFFKKTPLNSPYHGGIVDKNNKMIHDFSHEDREATDWKSGNSRTEEAIEANKIFQKELVEELSEPEVAVIPEPVPTTIDDEADEFEEEEAVKEETKELKFNKNRF